MNDRTYISMLLFGCAIILVAIVWMVLSFTTPPRSAEHTSVEGVSSPQIEALSRQIQGLSDRLGAPAGGPAVRTPEAPRPGEVLVTWTDDPLPTRDPDAPAWTGAPATAVPLQVQDQTMPVLGVATVAAVEVRALTDGRQIAWRLAWADPTQDEHLDTDLFCDAVAIQLPLEANAAYTMGAVDFPVQITQWKAIWQKDIDEHFQDVQDLHPNYWADLYWFAEGEFPYRVPDAFQRTESRDWFIAYRAGNPMAEFERQEPVQELLAEGYGTLSNQPNNATVARGVWDDGQWSVVFARPMQTSDAADYQFIPGQRDVVAFAVWEGGVANVGGRKHHSQWIVFEVQQ